MRREKRKKRMRENKSTAKAAPRTRNLMRVRNCQNRLTSEQQPENRPWQRKEMAQYRKEIDAVAASQQKDRNK